MSGRRLLTAAGAVGAAGAAYYFYNAGGDPKVAQKMAERDASRVTGGGKEAKHEGEEFASRAGKKFDDTVGQTKALGKEYEGKLGQKVGEAESKLSQLKADASGKFDETRKESRQAIDNMDKTVEKKASEAKSGISSWFGGK
ncbi:hypothetical protein MMC10_002180 [Thelotrema lepadinum]|nr:hypothetical protein [Thelotrema lepadinum]